MAPRRGVLGRYEDVLGAGAATTQRNAETADARGRHTAAALGEDRDG